MVSLSLFVAASPGALHYVQPWTLAALARNSVLLAGSIHSRRIEAPQRGCIE
jgi:hypothetical protein